jgi:hypothetical protein
MKSLDFRAFRYRLGMWIQAWSFVKIQVAKVLFFFCFSFQNLDKVRRFDSGLVRAVTFVFEFYVCQREGQRKSQLVASSVTRIAVQDFRSLGLHIQWINKTPICLIVCM